MGTPGIIVERLARRSPTATLYVWTGQPNRGRIHSTWAFRRFSALDNHYMATTALNTGHDSRRGTPLLHPFSVQPGAPVRHAG